MSKNKEYITIVGNKNNFDDIVNKKLEEGYIIHGSISTAVVNYKLVLTQPMVISNKK